MSHTYFFGLLGLFWPCDLYGLQRPKFLAFSGITKLVLSLEPIIKKLTHPSQKDLFVISSFECKYLIRETGLRDFQLFMLISLFFSKIVHLPYWLLVSNPKLRKQVWHFHQDHLVEILPWHRRAFDRGSWRKRVQEALLSTLWVDLKIGGKNNI